MGSPPGGSPVVLQAVRALHGKKTSAGRVRVDVRVLRIPLSTNVERVALVLAHKGLEVEWVDVDPDDRSPVRALSGQDLVPVLEHEGEVVHDSTRIIEWLEERHPDPPVYPGDPARRAEVKVFVDWFNRVWKRPPNEIAAELGKDDPDHGRIEALGRETTASLDLFETLLTGRDHLMGEFSVADCMAFPFLRFALHHEEGDPDVFHHVLVERLALGDGYPNLRAWLERMEARPRA